MIERTSRRRWAGAALCAALPMLWVLLVVAGPVTAQTTNSPSGGQNAGQAPQSGGPSPKVGSNTGGGNTSPAAGNGTTSGGAGATGGGASGAGKQDTGGGGRAGALVAAIAIIVLLGVGAMTFVRHRRVMGEVGAAR